MYCWNIESLKNPLLFLYSFIFFYRFHIIISMKKFLLSFPWFSLICFFFYTLRTISKKNYNFFSKNFSLISRLLQFLSLLIHQTTVTTDNTEHLPMKRKKFFTSQHGKFQSNLLFYSSPSVALANHLKLDDAGTTAALASSSSQQSDGNRSTSGRNWGEDTGEIISCLSS